MVICSRTEKMHPQAIWYDWLQLGIYGSLETTWFSKGLFQMLLKLWRTSNMILGCGFVGGLLITIIFLCLIGVIILWALFFAPNLMSCIVRVWVSLILPYNNIFLIKKKYVFHQKPHFFILLILTIWSFYHRWNSCTCMSIRFNDELSSTEFFFHILLNFSFFWNPEILHKNLNFIVKPSNSIDRMWNFS
jgi:hypothetical protein